ncbi:MAG: ABC transporter ATP-binding protein [Bradymonadaceae bacterium]|nr:ABC transporter ATP-binding protein [Lujinxingiaceae bacterium]
MTLIALEKISKSYKKGDTTITPLDGVDLEVDEGAFLALMGPSGSGKSTLLNLVAGIDRPSAGKVIVAGQDITRWSEDRLADWRTRAVGYVFQQFNLMPVLTAFENVELPLLLLPMSRAQRKKQVLTALELVGLLDRAGHYPRQLSGGQEQRVAIARAVATDPQIILADEPTGNLDRESATEVMNLLVGLNAELGKTIVIVTHDALVSAYASRKLHLDKGELVEASA